MENEKKQRGGARPNSGRKFEGKATELINFRIPAELKSDLKTESKRRREAGEESINAGFVTWANKQLKKAKK